MPVCTRCGYKKDFTEFGYNLRTNQPYKRCEKCRLYDDKNRKKRKSQREYKRIECNMKCSHWAECTAPGRLWNPAPLPCAPQDPQEIKILNKIERNDDYGKGKHNYHS